MSLIFRVSAGSKHKIILNSRPKLKLFSNSRSVFLFNKKREKTEDSALTKGEFKELKVGCYHGWPAITVPLASREERCRFILKPISNTVEDFYRMIKAEDGGIEKVTCLTLKGVIINSSTLIQHLLEENFHLQINKQEYFVVCPKTPTRPPEDVKQFSDLTHLVSRLYKCLNDREFQVVKEKELLKQRETLLMQLLPLELEKNKYHKSSDNESQRTGWWALGFMAVQTGVFARLTWWDFSWDIMEPVTYFTGYVTTMASFAYFILARQRYSVDEVKDRLHLLLFYKKARKRNFDIKRYNQLKDQLAAVDFDLKKLKKELMTVGIAKKAVFESIKSEIGK